jgi:heterodisulfide reductase subunit C
MKRERAKDQIGDLHQRVDAFELVPNLKECLACGKCTGGCPVAALNPSFNPRQIIRDVLSGHEERFLDSEEIWRCFWCASCYTGCPVDIHFPFLVMQLRYRALARRFGLRYVRPFKRFARRAREDALTFVPSPASRERIMEIREEAGMEPWPEVSERARAEYKALFDLTGTTAWLEELRMEELPPLRFSYLEGRVVDG